MITYLIEAVEEFRKTPFLNTKDTFAIRSLINLFHYNFFGKQSTEQFIEFKVIKALISVDFEINSNSFQGSTGC